MKRTLIIVALVLGAGLFLLQINQTDKTKNSSADSDYLTEVSSLRDAHGLAVDVADSSKVWIASHTGLHLLKDDKNLYLVGDGRDDYMGFSTHPTDANTFFTSGHPSRGGNLGFQKSTDAGKTWQKISDGLNGSVDFHSMTVDRVNPDVIYGVYQGRMQKSSDGGKTWAYVDNAPSSIIQLVAGAKENSVYAATQDGLRVSNNQGNSWSTVSPTLSGGTFISVGVNPKNDKELLSYSQQLGLAKSTDGGSNWTKVESPFSNDMVMYIAYDPNNSSTIYTLTRSLTIYKTTDSGINWTKARG